MTSSEKVTEGDRGGVSGPPKKGDVIYERPLIGSFILQWRTVKLKINLAPNEG